MLSLICAELGQPLEKSHKNCYNKEVTIENKRSYMNKRGFTLAEVLVTMGIIGVVAAVTMPALTGSSNSKQLQAQFNTAHSLLSQAVYNVAGQKGPGLQGIYAAFTEPDKEKGENGGYKNTNEFVNLFFKQLKTDGECRYNANEISNYNGTKSGNAVYIDRGTKTPSKRLTNGMCVDVNICAFAINITVDINGTKKPNKLGHDIFFFDIGADDKLNPKHSGKLLSDEELADKTKEDAEGTTNISSQANDPCSANSKQGGNGLGCAYWALLNQNPDDNSKTYWDNLPK